MLEGLRSALLALCVVTPGLAWAQAPAAPLVLPSPGAQDLAGRLVDDAGLSDRLMPPVERPVYRLPVRPLDPVSRNGTSVGTAEGGILTDAVQLRPRGPHHTILRAHRRRRHLHWGTRELVALVEHAADYVAARHPGSVLQVGNLSARAGGDIPYSHSHNSGRDVDLAFYLRGPTGRPRVPSDYARIAADGRVRGRSASRAAFDPARNWALVEALLSHPTVRVQWVLVAEHLRELLLTHARAHAADPDLVRRAEHVLAQPRASGSHDDHFHVRLYCPPDDLLDGCRPAGPRWAWIDPYERAFAERVEQLLDLFRSTADPSVRTPALQRLVAMSASEAAAPLAALLAHEAARWRVEIARTLSTLGDPAATPGLLVALQLEQLPGVAAALVAALGRLGGPGAWEAVAARLPPPPAPSRRSPLGADTVELTRAAALALGELGQEASVPRLLPLLVSPSAPIRQAAASSLQRLTNRRERSLRWWRSRRRTPASLAGAAQAWSRWWGAHHQERRGQWIVAGFNAAGYRVQAPVEFADAAHLIRACDDRRPYVKANAEAALRSLAVMRPAAAGESFLGSHFWRTWWYRTRRAHRLAG